MKKFKLSGFDLGIVIAFAVVALLGGGAWWYFSGALADAQKDDSDAKAAYDSYSKNAKYNVVVSPSNLKAMQDNIDLMKAQLLPVIQAEFLSKDNKLSSTGKEDPIAWKHDLDDEVKRLTSSAKSHNVTVPQGFYFGFSRYLSENPRDEQTAVLSKQLLGVESIANILIGAPVKEIQSIRRTYEEDPHVASNEAGGGDRLPGYSMAGAGATYTDYPFELVFTTTSENLRNVLSGLIKSPYVFIIRSVDVKNSNGSSPALGVLESLAGTPATSVTDTSPGEVAATTSTKGPQYLFGSETLAVKMRVDMIEWTANVSASADATGASPAGANGQPKKGGS